MTDSSCNEASWRNDEAHWALLMVSAQQGNEEDYRQLLLELSAAIDRYLRSRIGHHHFIEDCVQESLVAIHQARHTYDDRRLFRPWLFAIVRHKAIDILRRQRAYQQVLEKQLTSNALDLEALSCQSVDNAMIQGSLMDALTPIYREAITLTKIVGLSTAEAATQLSISESALKVRVHRAIGRLKTLLEAEDV